MTFCVTLGAEKRQFMGIWDKKTNKIRMKDTVRIAHRLAQDQAAQDSTLARFLHYNGQR